MTRKDYQAIAKAIAKVRADRRGGYGLDIEARHAIEEIEDGLAAVFAADNPRFNRDKFLTACMD